MYREQKAELLRMIERYAEAVSTLHHYHERGIVVPSAEQEYSNSYQELYWYIERL